MSQRPHLVQAALLYDGPKAVDLATAVDAFRSVESAGGVTYNVPEAVPGSFYRLFGTNNVMITLERIETPASAGAFEAALSSPFTRMACSDVRERVARHRSHVLVGVHHGSLTPDPNIQEMLQTLNMGHVMGDSLGQYVQRLALCGLMAHLVNRQREASLAHWTASDQLLPGSVFGELAIEQIPNLLHVHPLVFNGGRGPDGDQQFEVRTFGVGHFIGREIHVPPSPLSMQDIMSAVFAFMKLATMENGYVVPDGDVFGPESTEISFRVRHVEAGEKSGDFDGPLYRISLAYSRKHDFMAPDYVPREIVFDDRTVPPEVLNAVGPRRDEFVADIRARRETAEAAGMKLEVKAPVGMSDGRMAAPGRWPRIPFGRRKPN